MATSRKIEKEVRDPYTIVADGGELVDARTANPKRVIRIHGHRIKVSDIPINAARLDCGHSVRGIAFFKGTLVYCDRHGSGNLFPATVVEVV